MMKRYQIGKPIITQAVQKQITVEPGAVPGFTVVHNTEIPEILKKEQERAGCDCSTSYTITAPLNPEDVVYGLGESMRGINKRGWIYVSKCMDEPSHTEEKRSLYAAHNFILIAGKQKRGLFIDFPGIALFDIGYSDSNVLSITLAEPDADFYVIEGDQLKDIVHEFRELIGPSYIPPKWAFGYGQSRWSYMNEDEVREVVRQHRDNHIPLDSVYLDIDYMQRYKDFTVNSESFPNFKAFVEEMKEQNIHLVPIIDAGVKIEEGYSVYDEGVQKGYFCKDAKGENFVAAVWPGKVHFPDVLNEKAREWFGEKYQTLLDQGIDGFWNDMNEPAIFYSETRLNQALKTIQQITDKEMDLNTYWSFLGAVNSLQNNQEDYQSFYHDYDNQIIRHDRVHNLYGYYMTRAAAEAFERLKPDKRILLFSRSSYIGMHRYGGIWMGDNCAWWSHLLQNLKMLPSLNMCGFIYVGADLGGFGTDTTEELMLRWMALGIFTPLMRNHAAIGTRNQEVYQFTKTETFRKLIGIRYGLLPYLYSEYMKAARNNEMMFSPLTFIYPEDSHASQVEDQLMVGESMMIAPVYTQNATGRYVYLPETMKLVRMKSIDEVSVEVMQKGHHYIDVPVDEVIFFIRPEKIVPYTKVADSVDELDESKIQMFDFVTTKGTYEWYHDDGFTKDYDLEENRTILSINHKRNQV